jgi:catechol 2,3-dioxygenase-like lactoylglutathione lyase family enzyme
MPDSPELHGILETVLYHEPGEREAMERFYREVLALSVVATWGDGTALRIGSGVLLLFDRSGLAARDEPVADHGTAGPGHACLVAEKGEYEAWKVRLDEAGIAVTHEESWPGGGRSFYFKDPAGNLLEIAERDIWPK